MDCPSPLGDIILFTLNDCEKMAGLIHKITIKGYPVVQYISLNLGKADGKPKLPKFKVAKFFSEGWIA